MGGPRAWKEIQKKQQEFQGGWDNGEEQAGNNDGDEDDEDDKGEEKDVEKRDVYAEYGIDVETENEKSQRPNGVGDTGEMPGQEDVCRPPPRNLPVLMDVGIHHGYDAQNAECGTGYHWVRSRGTDMDRLNSEVSLGIL